MVMVAEVVVAVVVVLLLQAMMMMMIFLMTGYSHYVVIHCLVEKKILDNGSSGSDVF